MDKFKFFFSATLLLLGLSIMLMKLFQRRLIIHLKN